LRVWFNSRMRPCQGRDNGAIPFTRSIYIGSVAHQQSARVTCERQRGQHSPLPPFFRGHKLSQQSGCFTCTRSKARFLLPSPFLSLWCSPDNMPASHAGDHRSEAGQGRQFTSPSKHCQRCVRSVSESARCNSGWGLQFLGEWLSGNSRPHRSRICEPWRCKSSLAHQFQGVEATADRHRTFNPVW
jgi:hypothetical protein